MRDTNYDYYTSRVLKGSWLHQCIQQEAQLKRSVSRIPAMLRTRLEASYEQQEDCVDPESLAEMVVSAVQDKMDKMVFNALPIVRDEHVVEASTDDLDKMLDYFNKEDE